MPQPLDPVPRFQSGARRSSGTQGAVAVATLAGVGSVVLIGHALLLSSFIEPTTDALMSASRGERVMFFALPGLAISLLALVLRRRGAGMVLALGAVVLFLTAAGFDVSGA